jgi:hypothetical protein
MRRLVKSTGIAAAILLMLAIPAWAYFQWNMTTGEPVQGMVNLWLNGTGAAVPVSAVAPIPTSTPASAALGVQITRPANVTAYAAGQAVCVSTTVDCTPLTFAIGRTANGTGLIHGVQLIKSGLGVTNANFTVHLYSSAPTLTGIKDAGAFSPLLADITANAYRGSAACSGPTVNGDNAFYNCTMSNPSGANMMLTDASANLYAVIQANGAYTPASAEKFQVTIAALRD